MNLIQRFLLWLVWDGPIRLPGPLAPWLFGLAIGRRPHRVATAAARLPEARLDPDAVMQKMADSTAAHYAAVHRIYYCEPDPLVEQMWQEKKGGVR